MEVERPIAKFLPRRLMADRPRRYQLILGPRRVGKTTSMYQTVRRLISVGVDPKRLWWLRLDHPLLMQVGLDDLVRWIMNWGESKSKDLLPMYLFLDELTYAENWDLWLKTFYDEKWPIRITGTSSATASLRSRGNESGIGRWEDQFLAPYLFPEYLELVNRGIKSPVESTLTETIKSFVENRTDVSGLEDQRRKFLLVGGFPELLSTRDLQSGADELLLLQSQRILRTDAIERALYKDLPQAFGIESPVVLERLLYTLAAQATGIMSPANICENLGGLSQPTFVRYLSYLERAFLIFALPNYSGNEGSVQKRGRKLFFVDGAVRNAALQRGIGPLNDADEMGLLIENMAAGHLRALSEQSQVRLYYWRDKNDEVDFVYDHPIHPLAFEIGLSGRHHRRGLNALVQRYPKFKNRIYIVSPDGRPSLPEESAGGIGTLPLDLFLLAVGRQMEHEMSLRLHGTTPTLFDD